METCWTTWPFWYYICGNCFCPKQNNCLEPCWVVAHFDVCYQNACSKTTGSIKFHLKPKYWFCQVTPSGTCLSIATCLICIYLKAGKFPKRKYVVDNLKVEPFSFRARSYAIELAGVKRHIFYPLCTSFIWTLWKQGFQISFSTAGALVVIKV